jgi:hypothetical protein
MEGSGAGSVQIIKDPDPEGSKSFGRDPGTLNLQFFHQYLELSSCFFVFTFRILFIYKNCMRKVFLFADIRVQMYQ